MISVIICTYNRAESLQETIAGLASLTGAGTESWELIVADNGSTDDTRAAVELMRRRTGLPLLYLFEGRRGKSFALNAAVERAGGDIVAFTDDDVSLHPDWLVEIRAAFAQFDCAAIGGRILPVWPFPPPAWYSIQGPDRLARAIVEFDFGETPFLLTVPPFGANMAFRRSVFAEHGLFRTDLGPRPGRKRVGGGGEDTEFCRRILARDVVILYAPRVLVYHPVEAQRMTREYFKQWYFRYGQSRVRVSEAPGGEKRYFGIPRYLLRHLAESVVRSRLSLRPALRFQRTLEAYRIAGEIYEHFTAARHSLPPPAPCELPAPGSLPGDVPRPPAGTDPGPRRR